MNDDDPKVQDMAITNFHHYAQNAAWKSSSAEADAKIAAIRGIIDRMYMFRHTYVPMSVRLALTWRPP